MTGFVTILLTLVIGVLLERLGFFPRLEVVVGDGKDPLEQFRKRLRRNARMPVRVTMPRRVRPSTRERMRSLGLPVPPRDKADQFVCPDGRIGEIILEQEVGTDFLANLASKAPTIAVKTQAATKTDVEGIRELVRDKGVFVEGDTVLLDEDPESRDVLVLALSEESEGGIEIEVREGKTNDDKVVFVDGVPVIEIANRSDLTKDDVTVIFVPEKDLEPKVHF